MARSRFPRCVPRPLLRSALAGSALLAAFSSAWTGIAAATIEYDFVIVEAFELNYDLREVMLTGIDDTGHVVGWATHNGFYDGFVWTTQSDKTVLPVLYPRAINNHGQIVGDAQLYDMDTGQMTIVPPAGGYPATRLYGINDNGVAVGFAECSCSNSDGIIQTALVWDAQNGSRTIPVAGAKELLSVNSSNIAVGNIRGGSAGTEGFVHNIDTGATVNMTDGLPPYMYGRGWSELKDINDAGLAVGRGWDGQAIRGLTWSAESGFTFLPALDGGLIDKVFALGAGPSGQVVGGAKLADQSWRAFIWTPEEGMRNLNDLVTLPANFVLDYAAKMNAEGWIIGIGHYGPYWGTSRGFVLKPVQLIVNVDDAPAPEARLHLAPNPVRSAVTVHFEMPAAGTARLSIFDVAGREVDVLFDEVRDAGAQAAEWTPSRSLAAGTYFARLALPGRTLTQRLVWMP